MHRRQVLTAALGLTAVTTLPGCANPANRSTPAGNAAASTGASAEAAFPAQVKHRYGTTTVPSVPQRVVTLGQTDHDAVIALGVVPVAVSGFVGTSYSPTRPWNSAGLTSKPPVLNMLEIPFEKVAALAPDLILAVMSGVTKADYAKLKAIAPTIAQPVGYEDWAVPYAAHTALIGTALGQPGRAQQLVSDLDAAFADARATNPVLVGKRAICAELWGSDFSVLGSGAPRTEFLTGLGMTLGPLAEVAGKGYNAPLSTEKVDLLDQLDAIVWTTDSADVDTLLANRFVRTLRTVTEERYVLAPNGGNDDLLYSMDWGSVLSNRWALEHAVPRLVRAVDGDPATDPNT